MQFLQRTPWSAVYFFAIISTCLTAPALSLAANAPKPPVDSHVWTDARKIGVGTSAQPTSKVWFTLADGIVTEVYWPQIDMAQVTDLQFLITDGSTFFHEEKKDTIHKVEYLDDRSLAFRLTNTDPGGRYAIVKEIVTDPGRDTLIQHVTFNAKVPGLKLYVLFNPAASNTGLYDYAEAEKDALTAWDDRLKFAGSDPAVGQVQALVASTPFDRVSAGFVGFSDGWTDLHVDFTMDNSFDRAENGNVALTGQVSVPDTVGQTTFDLALGFGNTAAAAKSTAQASLAAGFPALSASYINGWKAYTSGLLDLSAASGDGGKLYYTSAMVLKAHEDKTFPGGMIASLTVPWGTSSADAASGDERGILPGSGPDGYKDGPTGYHVVWPRDLYQVATAFIAAGDLTTAENAHNYLRTIQFGSGSGNWNFCARAFAKNGSFPQNTWLAAVPHWPGLQMDETAMPIVLAWRLWKAGKISPTADYWSYIKPAAEFVSNNGPWTNQERWEENDGFSPSTIAAEIAGLVTAADFATANNDPGAANWYLKKADAWAAAIGDWTFTTTGFSGDKEYFERIDGTGCNTSPSPNDSATITIGNGGGTHPERNIIDGGFLELVRFGILPHNDPRILDTLPEYDGVISFMTPKGRGYHRYNFDGYGEKADGADYNGTGVGRLWPLLTGERGHYELAAANASGVDAAIATMEKFANEGRMLPEQVWDANPPAGKASGEGTRSATPLAWSHAEYIRLLRSKADGKIIDTSQVVADRYKDQ
jgi:glucoamylase